MPEPTVQSPLDPALDTLWEGRDGLSPADTAAHALVLSALGELDSGKARVARWRKILFSFLAKNSRAPTEFFKLPPNRVVELGLQIEL